MADIFRIVEVEIETCWRDLSEDSAGAYVVFDGRVRNLNDGRQVRLLEYEAYEPVATQEGEKILAEARERFAIAGVQCWHRVGTLQIGDLAIRAQVIAGHRAEAFDACRYVVDEIKRRVPIWKKEHYVDGDSGWLDTSGRLLQ